MSSVDFDATRARLVELYKLLYKVSVSRKNEITLGQITDNLNDVGELGSFERRTFYKDFLLLNEITNLDIEYSKSSRTYIIKRKDELKKSELTIIINAILSARFNSETETRSLADKLYTFSGLPKMPDGMHYIKNRVKLGDDKDTLVKIDFIHNAINQKQKVLFDYQKYNHMKNYEVIRRNCLVSPYKILWNNDKMYLVGNFSGNNFSHYRIERICNLRESKEKQININEIIGYGKSFDEAEYLRKMTEVSSGKPERVVIKFKNEKLGDIFDTFGKNVCIKADKDGSFTLDDEIFVNKKLIHWILGFGDSAEVLKPAQLRSKIEEAINAMGKIY
ncbi:MAG: WYL domain-containing protein [Lachnospiraceae bacterium]|nr:WYL domain-containing protein [Lachnospiraceae bacterium]